jgi:hypothetical protein
MGMDPINQESTGEVNDDAPPAWAGAWRDDPAGPESPRVRSDRRRPSEFRTSRAAPMCAWTSSRCSAGKIGVRRDPSVTLPPPPPSRHLIIKDGGGVVGGRA